MPHESSGAAPAREETGVISKKMGKRAEKRYRDAYRVAGFVIGVGTAAKAAGVIFGFVIAVFLASEIPGANAELTGAGWGLMIFALFFVVGVIISAQGQTLRASLDAAVHSSPFLDTVAKARAMGIEVDEEDDPEELAEELQSRAQLGWPGL